MAWSNPAVGRVSSAYGPRRIIAGTLGRTGSFHAGVDIANAVGTPVRSVDAGRVHSCGAAGGGLAAGRSGMFILVGHDDGSGTYYGHLSRIDCKPGDRIKRGQTIGLMGATGNVTGPHLHFEYRPNVAVITTADPAVAAERRGVTLGLDPKTETEKDDMYTSEDRWLAHNDNRALGRVEAVVKMLAQRTGVDVDEAALADALLESLSPESLADALIARGLGDSMITALGKRIGA